MKIKVKRISSILTTTIIISMFIYYGYNEIKSSSHNSEYPLLTRDTTLTGIVDTFFNDLYSSPRGALYIKLSDGFKFRTSINSYNNKISLYDFLYKGDSLCKPQGQDLLYIYKGGLKYIYDIPTQESYDSIFHKKN